MKVSFTGTRQGMSHWQKQQLEALLYSFRVNIVLFTHGGCMGADVEAHDIFKRVIPGAIVACYPSTAKTSMVPENCDFVAPPAPPLERGKKIVEVGKDLLIAAPLQMTETRRSGTWTTVRYARKKNVPVKILWREREDFKIHQAA